MTNRKMYSLFTTIRSNNPTIFHKLMSQPKTMKTLYFFLIALVGTTVNAQLFPVDFEPGGYGADWTWTVFENGDNPPLEIVANPDQTGINTSATVAKITVQQEGAPFAGCETMHGADVGTFSLSEDNAYVAMMVYKSVISDVGFKYATPEGASTGEIKVANTLIDQWERLVFDFTAVIGEPSSNGIDQIIVFPDFQNRSSDNEIYFDNIIFGDSSLLSTPELEENSIILAPNPATDRIAIQSGLPLDQLTIYDQHGRRVAQLESKSNNFEMNVSNLSSGIYFVQLTEQNNTSIKKLIIQ